MDTTKSTREAGLKRLVGVAVAVAIALGGAWVAEDRAATEQEVQREKAQARQIRLDRILNPDDATRKEQLRTFYDRIERDQRLLWEMQQGR